MSDTPEDSRVGSQFGSYRLNRLLGRGGMGEVYEAQDTVNDRVVALKLLSPELSTNPAFRERLQRAVRTAATVQEPHLVPVLDSGETEGRLYIAVPLIDGTDLGTLLRRFGPLSPPRAVAIMGQVAAALDAGHAAGVLHGDLKPADILITGDDVAYLVDFGIADATTDQRSTPTGSAVDSYTYTAPERLSGAEATYRADIYSLACVLYECLTGSPPYRADSMSVLISAHLMQPIPRPSQQRSGIPAAFDEVIARGMAKNPDDRYPTAGDLVLAAHQAETGPGQGQAGDVTVGAPAPTSDPPPAPFPPAAPPPPPTWPQAPSPAAAAPAPAAGAWSGGAAPGPRRSRRWWWIGAALLAVVLVAVAGVTAVILTGRGGGGADSPRAAVLDFLAAAERNDAFAAADLLDPDEQAGVRNVLDNFRDSAQRTGYQQGGGSNGLLQGLQISTDNVQTSVTNVRADLARVTFTGGQISLGFDASSANPGVRDLLDGKDRQRIWTADQLRTRSASGAVVEPAMMTVRRGDKWYVSVLYSVLDAVARGQDNGPADPGHVDTQTYSSPESAAQGFLDGLISTLTSASIMPVANTMSPDAGMLLATYRPLLESQMKPQRVRIVGAPTFTATTNGDTAIVAVDDLRFENSSSDGSTTDVEFHGNCITVGQNTRCDATNMNLGGLLLLKPGATGVIATKGAGGWHIDPVATYLDSAANLFKNASKDEVALVLSKSLPKALLHLDSQGQLSENAPNTVSLNASGALGFGFAVFDLPVRAGEQLTIQVIPAMGGVFSPRPAAWMAVGNSGKLAEGDVFGDASLEEFTAPDTETARVVVWGPAGGSVILNVTG